MHKYKAIPIITVWVIQFIPRKGATIDEELANVQEDTREMSGKLNIVYRHSHPHPIISRVTSFKCFPSLSPTSDVHHPGHPLTRPARVSSRCGYGRRRQNMYFHRAPTDCHHTVCPLATFTLNVSLYSRPIYSFNCSEPPSPFLSRPI